MHSIEEVLREHGPMLARIAASYERDVARREDLLQEISLALWRALDSWRGEASLRTFAARIAHNRAIDHLGTAATTRKSLTSNIPTRWPIPPATPKRINVVAFC